MSSWSGFTRSQARTLGSVAEAVVGDAVDRRGVVRAAEAFVARLPRADRRRLGVLLLAIEHGARLGPGRLRRFSALDTRRRRDWLARWADSRIAPRRQGFSAVRSLAMLAHYGREDAWDDIGYDGPWLGRVDLPVLPAPAIEAAPATTDARGEAGGAAAQRPWTGAPAAGGAGAAHANAVGAGVTRGRSLDRDLALRADVCVIGTGAGGAASIARLAERGLDAVALEAGGHPTADDFDQRELTMLPLLYHEAGLRATADKAIGILQGRGVGGSTLHNTGLVVRPPPAIVDRWRREHGFTLDDAALEAYVLDAVDTLRASAIPPERINAANDALRRGADALGWRYTIAMHNRAECSGCGYCMLGCAYNRKYNAALTCLPRAVDLGARILADSPAVRIERVSGGWRAVAHPVDADGEPTGRRVTVDAPVVVLAAGALASPALLRRSGLGGRRVGRGLRLHPSALVTGVFPDAVDAWRGVPQSVILEEFASFRDDGRGGFLVIPFAMWPGLTAALLPGMGDAHREAMRDFRRFATAAVLLHDETEGRVRAARDGRPVASYWPDASDRRALRDGVRSLARLYLAAGAERVHLPYAGVPAVEDEAALRRALERASDARHRVRLSSVHPQGSCPIGDRPDAGAVDPLGALHGERGVYVCDTSIFPTSVGVPPQVTAMALGAAVADRIADDVARGRP